MDIPKSERQWLTVRDGHGQVQYIVTSTLDCSVYKLYVPGQDGWNLWGKHRSAGELARKYESQKIKS